MANTVKLEFAGDADKLVQAGKKAETAVDGVGDSVTTASDDFSKGAKESSDFTTKIGKLGAGVDGMSTAVDDAAGTLSALNDVQQAGKQKAQALARAQNDVQQAQEDMAQATRDASQATIDQGQAQIDAKQADIDAATAIKTYNSAVKEHGKGSLEARQASLDLTQAQLDLRQASEDSAQYTRDAAQATIDAGSAQLDLNEAQAEAHPPDLAVWSQGIQTYAPLLSGLIGITGLVTAAQWAWNAAQLASPLTWIIVGIVALVAVIVLIATKTTWFQTIWRVAWSGIKAAASATWDFIKNIPGWIETAFKKIVGFITWPFRTAFNLVADAWNHTIGALSFTFPGWIPGIGGNSINVPDIPKFHGGGVVPGAPGQETLALLQGGEEVKTAADRGDRTVIEIRSSGAALDDLIAELLARSVRGNVQLSVAGR